ncbi:hypothetical protein [Nocardia brasiliensis]|uniref:hypothetical protein n=1 Tax=Nocardia brasiliensis TaxID=37326 RepID=UPI003D8C973C
MVVDFCDGESSPPTVADIALVRRLDDPGTRKLACAAAELSASALEQLSRFADRLREAEGLPTGMRVAAI